MAPEEPSHVLPEGCRVRRATADDAAALAALEAEARAAVASQRGGAQWLEENPAVDDWTAAAQDCVLLAEIDHVAVGLLQMAPLDARRVARVAQVFVLPDAREIGLGDLMLELATSWAVGAGAVAIEGVALPGDRDTKNLYERAGITARKITVYRRLTV